MATRKVISFVDANDVKFDIFFKGDHVVISEDSLDIRKIYIAFPINDWKEIVEFIQKNIE